MARLKDRYNDEIRPALISRYGYTTPMQAPRLVKVTLNMGVGEAKQDSKMLEAAQGQLADIAGQKPNVRRARKSVAAFKLREGMPVGLTVTLRGERAYEFIDRLVSVAIPRLRDFRGLDIAITTTAETDAEAFALLDALGLPFAREGRPAGFESLTGEPVAA